MAKEIKYGAEARKALEAGVNQLELHLDLKEETLYLQSHTVHHSSQLMVLQ